MPGLAVSGPYLPNPPQATEPSGSTKVKHGRPFGVMKHITIVIAELKSNPADQLQDGAIATFDIVVNVRGELRRYAHSWINGAPKKRQRSANGAPTPRAGRGEKGQSLIARMRTAGELLAIRPAYL
jgi:hypothetical protein